MANLKHLLPFSFFERFEIILFKIGSKIKYRRPHGIMHCYNLIKCLVSSGIKVKNRGENLSFSYLLNSQNFNIELKKKSSDPQVFDQIMIEQEYESIIKIIRNNNISMNLMLDGGANIGLTTLYFKSMFPGLEIIAFEPSVDTFQRLKKNVENNNLKLVKTIKKGLWSSTKSLKADNSFRDGQDWSFRLTESLPHEKSLFEVVSINDVVEENKIKYIDFLKIDIEGGEVELFKSSSNLDWLKKVKLLAIEIHHEFNCKEQIESILVENNFELSYSGELTIGINRALVNQ